MRRGEAANDAGEDVDAAIDPGSADTGGGAVGEDASFAVVECADDYLCPTEMAKADIGEEIAVDGLGVDAGINLAGGGGGGGGFEAAFIFFAKENRATEVAGLDAVHIDDEDVADAQKSEIFDDFIAECAGADDEDARGGDFFLVPPFDGAEAGEALFGEVDNVGREGGHGFKLCGAASCTFICASVAPTGLVWLGLHTPGLRPGLSSFAPARAGGGACPTIRP